MFTKNEVFTAVFPNKSGDTRLRPQRQLSTRIIMISLRLELGVDAPLEKTEIVEPLFSEHGVEGEPSGNTGFRWITCGVG